MSSFKSILGKRNINLPGLSKRNIKYNPLKKIKTFLTTKKLDYSLLNSLGKGKWLIEFVFFNENGVSITSVQTEEILLYLLKNLIKNKKIYFKLDLEFNFWDDIKPQTGEKIILGLKEIKKIEYKFEKIDEEINGLHLSSKGVVNANNLLNELINLLDNKNQKIIFYNLKLNFKTEKNLIGEINLEGNDLNIKLNTDKNKIIELLSSILGIPIKREIINYFMYYADIKKIEGNWKIGKRRGYLVQEYGDKDKIYVKKFKF